MLALVLSGSAPPDARPAAVEDGSRALALAAQRGDRRALEALLRRHAADVATLCHHLLGPPDSRDAAQEALLKVVRELPRFDPERGRFGGWAAQIARNVCRDRLRRRGLERRTFEDDGAPHEERAPASAPDPERGAMLKQDAEALTRALEGLPEPMREAILMFHLGELSYEQIARELDVPMGTVMTWLHRGRKRLRAAIEEP